MQFMDSTLFHPALDPAARARIEQSVLDNVVRALAEDIGSGDRTAALIPAGQQAVAAIVCREPAVICGLPWARQCFQQLDTGIRFDWRLRDGDAASAGQTLVEIRGNARAMLTAERCALNFLQTLSATATRTRRFVDAVKGTRAAVLDTRKTIPGLRLAQKYAVLAGGGVNQRIGLYDGILIKENHIAAAGGIRPALDEAQRIGQDVPIQIEVETLADLETALDAGARAVLLDNFSHSELAEAVKRNRGRAVLEASGGIDLATIRSVALTGVDRISVGQLTKHLDAIDLSMRFRQSEAA